MRAVRILAGVVVGSAVLLFAVARLGNIGINGAAATAGQPREVNQLTASLQQLQALALSGDYQAQRNLAYSLSRGWSDAPADAVEGCAWRKVILMSRHPSVDVSDVSNHDYECGKLAPAQQSAAQRRAEELARQIYGRKAA